MFNFVWKKENKTDNPWVCGIIKQSLLEKIGPIPIKNIHTAMLAW